MRNLKKGRDIPPPKGKLGILIPGIGGAVSTTFIAGVELVRRGLAEPVGSLTQLGTIRLGKRFEHRSPKIKDFVPLADLNDLVFGGWDVYEANCFEAALYARVLNREHLDPVRDFLSEIRPMKAVFDRRFVKNLDGTYIKSGSGLRGKINELKADIAEFKARNNLDRCVMIWCGSTEVHLKPQEIHRSVESLQKAIDENDPVFPEHALCPGGPGKRSALRQRRTQPHVGCSCYGGSGRFHGSACNGEGFQDRPDADENDPGARP